MVEMDLGIALKRRRKSLKITQPRLAQIAGVSVNTVCQIERGQANPTLDVLGKIADVMGLEISLTFPKSQKEYSSPVLFPFFFNMLSEGANRQLQSRLLKIDENDYFGLLAATAETDTIGAVTLKPVRK